jgi:peroxiredoxin family protein
MKKMAVLVTRGSMNNLVNLFTLTMAAAVSEYEIRIFLRDEAVLKLTLKEVDKMNLSEGYRGMEGEVAERIRTYALGDLRKLIQELKERGDVKLYACTSSMAICGLTEADLIPEIDEPRGLTSFLLEEMAEAQMILTF